MAVPGGHRKELSGSNSSRAFKGGPSHPWHFGGQQRVTVAQARQLRAHEWGIINFALPLQHWVVCLAEEKYEDTSRSL